MSPYIVSFVRADNKPNEEYYYHTLEEAREHFSLFLDDSSGLYRQIQIENYAGELIAINYFPSND